MRILGVLESTFALCTRTCLRRTSDLCTVHSVWSYSVHWNFIFPFVHRFSCDYFGFVCLATESVPTDISHNLYLSRVKNGHWVYRRRLVERTKATYIHILLHAGWQTKRFRFVINTSYQKLAFGSGDDQTIPLGVRREVECPHEKKTGDGN